VCGVAMRENETILIADVCGNDTGNPYLTYNAKGLPKDAGIKVSDAGRKFKVSNIPIRFWLALPVLNNFCLFCSQC